MQKRTKRILTVVLLTPVIAILGYALWLASMFGMLGPLLMPRGEDSEKLQIIETLKKEITAGTPRTDVEAALARQGLHYSECRPAPEKYTSYHGFKVPPSEGSCVIRSLVRDHAYTGIVTWSTSIVIVIRDNRVENVVFDITGTGP